MWKRECFSRLVEKRLDQVTIPVQVVRLKIAPARSPPRGLHRELQGGMHELDERLRRCVKRKKPTAT